MKRRKTENEQSQIQSKDLLLNFEQATQSHRINRDFSFRQEMADKIKTHNVVMLSKENLFFERNSHTDSQKK
jgi:hypothetical protein